MWIWLLLLLPVVAIAVLVWNYRRQAAAREAASAERMEAFFGKRNADAITKTADDRAPAAPPPRGARPQLFAVSGFTVRAPLLSAEQLAVYQLLKSALPECEVFPCMCLSAFVLPDEKLTGFARAAQTRRLADAMVDFLVCDKHMKPLAVMQLKNSTGKVAETAAFAAACTAAIGVRWLELEPAALPAVEDLRTLVLAA
jgi:hypothetical protein